MRAVLCTIPSDSHSWNLVFLELFMRERGVEVINLGVCTPLEKICDSIRANFPDLVVVSSVNGHACIEGPVIMRRLKGAFGSSCPPVVLGGKVGVRGAENVVYRQGLLDDGFSEVYCECGGDDGTIAFEQYLCKLRSICSLRASNG